MVMVNRGLRVTSGANLVCWQKVDILNIKCDANCATNKVNWLVLVKNVRQLPFCAAK